MKKDGLLNPQILSAIAAMGHTEYLVIADAGLRGFQVGGAQVSEKHCGFVINRDHATAADIMELMRQVQIRVKENSGVDLEPEVKRLGDE